jgi:hypothetical protein
MERSADPAWLVRAERSKDPHSAECSEWDYFAAIDHLSGCRVRDLGALSLQRLWNCELASVTLGYRDGLLQQGRSDV